MTSPKPQSKPMAFASKVTQVFTRRWRGSLPRWAPRLPTDGPTCSHVVQFYAGRFPADDIAAYLRAGLDDGEGALVAATPQHSRAIARLLEGHPVTYLDAQATLDRFLVHGHPDKMRFLDTVGVAVRKAASQGNGRVRAFGEMVVLLCERGEPQAAAELEGLWNQLSQRVPLNLLCSYPAGTFSGRSKPHAARLRDLHSHTL